MATEKVAAPAEATQPEDNHPDFVYSVPGGQAVYRWTGKMTRQVNGVDVPFAGKCGVCGIETYHCISHPLRKDSEVGDALATYAPGGRNEPPMVYCQAHQPGADHRKLGGRLTPERDGAVVREKP